MRWQGGRTLAGNAEKILSIRKMFWLGYRLLGLRRYAESGVTQVTSRAQIQMSKEFRIPNACFV